MKARPLRTNEELHAAHKAGEYVEFTASRGDDYDDDKYSSGWVPVSKEEILDANPDCFPDSAEYKREGYKWRAWPKEE